MFRTLIYPSSGACDCVVELPHWSSCSQFVVCWRFGAASFGWCSFCRLDVQRCLSPCCICKMNFLSFFRVNRKDFCSSTSSALKRTAKLQQSWRSSARRTKALPRQDSQWTRSSRWVPLRTVSMWIYRAVRCTITASHTRTVNCSYIYTIKTSNLFIS